VRAGFVAVAGRPNVGKSTLLNRLVGQKLAITSPRAQSTRDRVTGILTIDDTQMVLVDTPGLLDPSVALQEIMRATALRALHDADVILHLVDATERAPKTLQELAGLGAVPRAPGADGLHQGRPAVERGQAETRSPAHTRGVRGFSRYRTGNR
jgi:GTP-binding protein Era